MFIYRENHDSRLGRKKCYGYPATCFMDSDYYSNCFSQLFKMSGGWTRSFIGCFQFK
jgi:hypothetical protein